MTDVMTAWSNLLQAAEVSGFRFHDLRRLSGYRLYYPNRRQPAAFALVMEALRYNVS